MLTVTPIDPLHKSDGSNGVKGAAEGDKNRRMRPDGPNGSMSMGRKKVDPIVCVEPITK